MSWTLCCGLRGVHGDGQAVTVGGSIMAEQPVSFLRRRCAGCGKSFVAETIAVEFCDACQSGGDSSGANPALRRVPQFAATQGSEGEPAAGQPPLKLRRPESSPVGLSPKTTWSSPPFQVSWDDNKEYASNSNDNLPASRAPSRSRRRRVLLALLAGVSVLVLISRLDAPSVDLVWRDRFKSKATEEKPQAHPPLPLDLQPVRNNPKPGPPAPVKHL
ncbi:MAG: hypothetical protein HY290_30765 [Planctomycetia bacterium]|nr:hypothetical protein [Planctomycetia bacterium]